MFDKNDDGVIDVNEFKTTLPEQQLSRMESLLQGGSTDIFKKPSIGGAKDDAQNLTKLVVNKSVNDFKQVMGKQDDDYTKKWIEIIKKLDKNGDG